MSKETFDTLGSQKEKNYALVMNSKQEFVKELTTGILPPPQYFAKNAMLNKTGYDAFEDVMKKGDRALSPAEVENLVTEHGAMILDVRKPQEFAKEHIPNSIFIGIDGQFAPWVGALITDLKQAIIVVAPEGRENEVVMRLSRVGYDNCLGYVSGGIEGWKKAGKELTGFPSISADEFAKRVHSSKLNILDVRKPGEYDNQHLKDVPNKPLDFINEWTNSLDKNKEYHIHCAGGYRSVIAASILQARGFDKLVDVAGGFGAIQKTNLELTCEASCSKS